MQRGDVYQHVNQHREGPGIRWCSDCGRKEPDAGADRRLNPASEL